MLLTFIVALLMGMLLVGFGPWADSPAVNLHRTLSYRRVLVNSSEPVGCLNIASSPFGLVELIPTSNTRSPSAPNLYVFVPGNGGIYDDGACMGWWINKADPMGSHSWRHLTFDWLRFHAAFHPRIAADEVAFMRQAWRTIKSQMQQNCGRVVFHAHSFGALILLDFMSQEKLWSEVSMIFMTSPVLRSHALLGSPLAVDYRMSVMRNVWESTAGCRPNCTKLVVLHPGRQDRIVPYQTSRPPAWFHNVFESHMANMEFIPNLYRSASHVNMQFSEHTMRILRNFFRLHLTDHQKALSLLSPRERKQQATSLAVCPTKKLLSPHTPTRVPARTDVVAMVVNRTLDWANARHLQSDFDARRHAVTLWSDETVLKPSHEQHYPETYWVWNLAKDSTVRIVPNKNVIFWTQTLKAVEYDSLPLWVPLKEFAESVIHLNRLPGATGLHIWTTANVYGLLSIERCQAGTCQVTEQRLVRNRSWRLMKAGEHSVVTGRWLDFTQAPADFILTLLLPPQDIPDDAFVRIERDEYLPFFVRQHVSTLLRVIVVATAVVGSLQDLPEKKDSGVMSPSRCPVLLQLCCVVCFVVAPSLSSVVWAIFLAALAARRWVCCCYVLLTVELMPPALGSLIALVIHYMPCPKTLLFDKSSHGAYFASLDSRPQPLFLDVLWLHPPTSMIFMVGLALLGVSVQLPTRRHPPLYDVLGGAMCIGLLSDPNDGLLPLCLVLHCEGLRLRNDRGELMGIRRLSRSWSPHILA